MKKVTMMSGNKIYISDKEAEMLVKVRNSNNNVKVRNVGLKGIPLISLSSIELITDCKGIEMFKGDKVFTEKNGAKYILELNRLSGVPGKVYLTTREEREIKHWVPKRLVPEKKVKKIQEVKEYSKKELNKAK